MQYNQTTNKLTAILSTPIFSSTGEMAFAASAGPQFTAVMLQDGVSAWTVNTESLIEASPVLSGDVVYTIEVSLQDYIHQLLQTISHL